MRINKEIFYEDIENGREILIFNKFNPFRFRILTNFEIYYPNRYKKGLKDGEKYNYSDIRDIRFGKQNYYLISCIKIWGYGRGNSGINYLVKKFFE